MRITALCWIAVLTAGCARSHVEPERTGLRNGEVAGNDALAMAGRGTAGAGGGARDPVNPLPGDPVQGGAGTAALPGSDAAVPPMGSAGTAGAPPDETVSGSEPTQVWIGQLWSIAPLLCDPNAPWSDTPLIVQPMGYTERVVLILEMQDAAHPSGAIAFGEGELPAVPEIPTGGDPGSFWLCSIQIPSKGGEYTLLDAVRSSDRLTFVIVPSEIWNASCPDGDTSCHCETELCSGKDLVGQRVSLDFLVTGDDMQATFLAAAFGTTGELRLRRVQ